MKDTLSFAHELFDSYERYAEPSITSCHFSQDQLLTWLKPLDASGVYAKTNVGASAEQRPLALYTLGTGSTRVLLWSQMHGDEPTATMALVDIFRWFWQNRNHPAEKLIREKLQLLIIPMLNPDGAERNSRRTAYGIDMNRDALALQTPEAQVLKRVRDEYQPEFGFNLHDQDPRLTVGNTKKITAMALLAPAFNNERSDNPVRIRAKHLASVLATIAGEFIPGHIARWDDSYEPRAFGDSVQRWGTSTVLIESGGWKNDPNKFFIRKLNTVSILASLYAIARGAYTGAPLEVYEKIPFNTKFGFDCIVRNVRCVGKNIAQPARIDVGIFFDEVKQDRNGAFVRQARIMDVGDLSHYTAFEEIDGTELSLDAESIHLETPIPPAQLSLLVKR